MIRTRQDFFISVDVVCSLLGTMTPGKCFCSASICRLIVVSRDAAAALIQPAGLWVTRSPSTTEVIDGWPNRCTLNCHAFTRFCGAAKPCWSASHRSSPPAGEPCPAAQTGGVEAHDQDTCSTRFRPALLGGYQHDVVAVDEGLGHRPAANACSLASGRIPALLALEIAATDRSSIDRS